ncbi:choline-sulfatase [Roseovarius sp. C7]|uniref:choline-sulfatase n=1 Tax=Roseovarius sp. C7 TaxID=3398643 RepID=UPI0039F741E0
MSRPNILVIQADQLTALCLSAYGKPYAITPNIDKLAEQGTTFENSYCNNPVCGPSRASMMTGRLPSDVGVFDNGAEFLPSEPTYAHYLRCLGYKTSLAGKMHFVGPDQLHGFEERLTTDIYPSDFAWTADWDQTDEPYAPSRMSLLSVVEAGPCERNLQIDYDEEVFHAARQELYNHARSLDERPFMMHVSFTQPHNPFVAGRKYWDLYEGVEIPEPEVAHIPYEERDAWSQRYYLTIRQDEFDVTDEQIRNARRGYFAMVSHLDELVGGLLEVLSSIGQRDNTYIFITSDHGEMLGERGMWYKFNPYEASVRVPLIAQGPGFEPGAREEALASLVDLLPTFTDIASEGSFDGYAAPYDGRSLFKLPKRHSPEDKIFVEFNGEGLYAPAMIVIKGDLKLVHSRTDPKMLFDLAKDPLELTNLAEDPAYRAALDDLTAEMEARWDETALDARIRSSQRKRLFVHHAMKHGRFPSWDFGPDYDPSKVYVRGGTDPSTTATKQRGRFPYVPVTPPENPRKSGG